MSHPLGLLSASQEFNNDLVSAPLHYLEQDSLTDRSLLMSQPLTSGYERVECTFSASSKPYADLFVLIL
jgi:hypothetical protein